MIGSEEFQKKEYLIEKNLEGILKNVYFALCL